MLRILYARRELTKLTAAHYYFKLDPNIRNSTEVLFGRMELEGLANQRVEPITHFYDVLKKPPISYFDNQEVRIQDFLLNLRTVYGNVQGYHLFNSILDLTPFVERLAYTREIYACVELTVENLENVKQSIFPHCIEGKNLQVWLSSDNGKQYCLFRVVTNQFFLEQINNVVLCSAGSTRERQIERMNDNINRLVSHIMENIRNYVPKFPRDANWKEFEDFVDEPNEITLYLTHFYGPPYKAKFHPRMIKALLNYCKAHPHQITGDFFLGSGTLAIESVLLGLATKGSDVNPLGEIVAKAKIDALSFDPKQLLEHIDGTLSRLPEKAEIDETKMSTFTSQFFRGKRRLRDQALFLNNYIRAEVPEKYRNFFLCALARTVSYAYRMKTEPDVFRRLGSELWSMWKFVYCLNEAMRFLHVQIGDAEIKTDDIRTLNSVGNETIDLIITSPPYSTAIDYVKMDLAQLLLLELIEEPKELDKNMIGAHRKTADIERLLTHISQSKQLIADRENRFHKIPFEAQKYIADLIDDMNVKTALRCYKFLYDMWDAESQMHRVLKPEGKCIIIIGNNNFTIKGKEREFRNGDFLEEMALNKEIGFSKWREKMTREYSKSSYGTILKEDIIFVKKSPSE